MRRLLPLVALFLALPALAELNPEWTTPLPPFQIADNLYYVGSRDLAAFLVTTPAGNVLINANLEMSPPQIRASVEKRNGVSRSRTGLSHGPLAAMEGAGLARRSICAILPRCGGRWSESIHKLEPKNVLPLTASTSSSER